MSTFFSKLLWHGSRLMNWFGVLLKGLRIAPAEAPMAGFYCVICFVSMVSSLVTVLTDCLQTGYMFGKGIYFADCASKSANYCDARPGQRGFLLLSQVALGKCQERRDEDYKASVLDQGCHSTMGVGEMHPNPRQTRKM